MRPLAIELGFDAVSDARLRRVWAAAAAIGGEPATAELGVAPHVTLALFRRDEPARDLAPIVAALAARVAPFALDLASVERFTTGEGVVYLRPQPSAELTFAHGDLHGALGDEAVRVDPYYRPGAWQPHCTLALEIAAARMEAVVAACAAAAGRVEITRLQLVRYRPATVVMAWPLDGTSGEIVGCYVHPEAGRRGVGGRLLAALEACAVERGLRRLHLDASLNAVAFYRRAGFADDGPSRHVLEGGLGIACRRMSKSLAPARR